MYFRKLGQFKHVAYGAARGAVRGGYDAYRAGPSYDDNAQIAGDLLANILRDAGVNASSGNANIWDAVTQGVTQTFLTQYDTAMIATNATPPVTVNLKDALASGPPSPVTKWLQPTVILTGPGGQQVIAPYGVSSGSQGGLPLLVLSLVGVGFILGKIL